MATKLVQLGHEIETCERCERLRTYCAEVARVKRRAYREWDYWGRPVAGFGDPLAELFILGLAPAAHGANRTGRVFTGDRSGDWLYGALHDTGFANQAESSHRGDGLELKNAWVSAAVRCAPPDNKPSREEMAACHEYFERELQLLKRVKVVVVLGRIAFESYLGAEKSGLGFGHGVVHERPGRPLLICSYHPSQQNTQTGRLTRAMWLSIFETARGYLQRV